MAQLADLLTLALSATTGLRGEKTALKLSEKGQNLIPPQPLAQDCPPGGVGPMTLKHILREIKPDRGNLRHGRPPWFIRADPPWHIDAVRGRLHHQTQRAGDWFADDRTVSEA